MRRSGNVFNYIGDGPLWCQQLDLQPLSVTLVPAPSGVSNWICSPYLLHWCRPPLVSATGSAAPISYTGVSPLWCQQLDLQPLSVTLVPAPSGVSNWICSPYLLQWRQPPLVSATGSVAPISYTGASPLWCQQLDLQPLSLTLVPAPSGVSNRICSPYLLHWCQPPLVSATGSAAPISYTGASPLWCQQPDLQPLSLTLVPAPSGVSNRICSPYLLHWCQPPLVSATGSAAPISYTGASPLWCQQPDLQPLSLTLVSAPSGVSSWICSPYLLHWCRPPLVSASTW
ncbi:UNVERIFIED_CONTAM: hypothetical protein FKN15_030837 [Acipenser sinensis]